MHILTSFPCSLIKLCNLEYNITNIYDHYNKVKSVIVKLMNCVWEKAKDLTNQR